MNLKLNNEELRRLISCMDCWICRHNTSSLLYRWWRRHTVVSSSGLWQTEPAPPAAAATIWWWTRRQQHINQQRGWTTWHVRRLRHSWPCFSSGISGSSSNIAVIGRQRDVQEDDVVHSGRRSNGSAGQRQSKSTNIDRHVSTKHQ